MLTTKEFLAEIDGHLARTGETASRFGMRVLGDPSFVTDVRRGKQPRLDTAAKVMAAIDDGRNETARAAALDGDGARDFPVGAQARAGAAAAGEGEAHAPDSAAAAPLVKCAPSARGGKVANG